MKDEILKFWRWERKNDQIVKLPPDFGQRVKEYLDHLSTKSEDDKEPVIRKIFGKLHRRIKFLSSNLFALRAQKICNLIIKEDSEIFTNLSDFETKSVQKLSLSLSNYKNSLLVNGSSKENVILEDDSHPNTELQVERTKQAVDNQSLEMDDDDLYSLVCFIEDEEEEILGADFSTYGPYIKGEYDYIPLENAKELNIRKKIKFIQVKHSQQLPPDI